MDSSYRCGDAIPIKISARYECFGEIRVITTECRYYKMPNYQQCEETDFASTHEEFCKQDTFPTDTIHISMEDYNPSSNGIVVKSGRNLVTIVELPIIELKEKSHESLVRDTLCRLILDGADLNDFYTFASLSVEVATLWLSQGAILPFVTCHGYNYDNGCHGENGFFAPLLYLDRDVCPFEDTISMVRPILVSKYDVARNSDWVFKDKCRERKGWEVPISVAVEFDSDRWSISNRFKFFNTGGGDSGVAKNLKSSDFIKFTQDYSLIFYPDDCNKNAWFEYEGESTPDTSCVVSYPEGHDLSLKVGVENQEDISQVSFSFQDQVYTDTLYPFEWTDIATNMAPGSYPVTATIATYCADTIRKSCTILIESKPCTSDFWFEYEGEDQTASNCALVYPEGHDLSVKFGGDDLEEIADVTLKFRDQIYFSDSLPFEFIEIDQNMDIGNYPISMCMVTTCGDTLLRECLIVIVPQACEEDYWLVYEGNRTSDEDCQMSFEEGEDITILVGGSNMQNVSEVVLQYDDQSISLTSYPFEWTDKRRTLGPGTYPLLIEITDKMGNQFTRNCNIVITGCEMTFSEGHNLSVAAGGDQSDITEATLFFMDNSYRDTTAPFEWINISENMAIGSYPLSMSITDNCDSTIIKNCNIIIEERTCTSDFWFEYQGERTSSTDCVMRYPEGHDLTLVAGFENKDDINLVTFIYGNRASVVDSFPYEWVDADTNMQLGTSAITMIVSTVCGSTFIRECSIVIESKECYTGYYFDFTSHPSENGVSAPENAANTELADALEGLEEKTIENTELENGSSDRSIEFIEDPDKSSINNNLSTARSLEITQNKPNPFDDSTIFRFFTPSTGNLSLSVIDMSGKIVWNQKTLYDRGWHEISISTAELSGAGVYIYELSNGLQTVRQKMMSME